MVEAVLFIGKFILYSFLSTTLLFVKLNKKLKSSLNQRKTHWLLINKTNFQNLMISRSKPLVIYSYSISNNFLKEAFAKTGLKFILTNKIEKASLIIGLKKYLRQNFKLKELAKRKKIPIYSFNQISIYQLTKFIKTIN